MRELATLELIGGALALVAPSWLGRGPPGGETANRASHAEAAVRALHETSGDAGLRYFDALTVGFTRSLDVLILSDVGDDVIKGAADTMERACAHCANRDRPPEIRALTSLLNAGEGNSDAEVRDLATSATAWVAKLSMAESDASATLIWIAFATLLAGVDAQPDQNPNKHEPRDASDRASAKPANTDPQPLLPTLIAGARDIARQELTAARLSELEPFGLGPETFEASADVARSGQPDEIERLARTAEQHVVRTAITDMPNARHLGSLAMSCRVIRGWAAAAAGRFRGAAGHFRLAVRHVATEPVEVRAQLQTRSIEMNLLASFASDPEAALLAAREQAATLGTLVKDADVETRLRSALVIGETELAVGRGFEQSETVAAVVAFVGQVGAEARLAGLPVIAVHASLLACRVRLTLITLFAEIAEIEPLSEALDDIAAEAAALDDGQVNGSLARVQSLSRAAAAILCSEHQDALTSALAVLSPRPGEPSEYAWRTPTTASAISDCLEAAFLRLRLETTMARYDASAEERTLRIANHAEGAADFGIWLSPRRAALLQGDLATLLRAEPIVTAAPDEIRT
ncbi:MAG: hypothetical protein AAGG99_08085 [Pseudomonadota bacterium]